VVVGYGERQGERKRNEAKRRSLGEFREVVCVARYFPHAS